MNKCILGIDPGSRITGFGVLQVKGSELKCLQHGVFQLNIDASSYVERLFNLGQSMRQIIQQYQPQHIVVEKIFLGKNADSAFKLGQARGVVMYEAALHGVEVYEYATRSVKKGVTGSGAAEKEQVRGTLQFLLQLRGVVALDASDALAMAYYHAIELQKQNQFSRAREI